MANSRTVTTTILTFALAAISTLAQAQEVASPPPRRVGVGYKIGNGIGFVGGNIVLRIIDHLSLDLQANYASIAVPPDRATGFGLAPGIHGELRPRGSTPYVAAGPIYIRLKLDNVVASGNGVFANLGYHWKWASGVGLLIGAGVGHISHMEATDGVTTIESSGGTYFNIEGGVHYMFL